MNEINDLFHADNVEAALPLIYKGLSRLSPSEPETRSLGDLAAAWMEIGNAYGLGGLPGSHYWDWPDTGGRIRPALIRSMWAQLAAIRRRTKYDATGAVLQVRQEIQTLKAILGTLPPVLEQLLDATKPEA